MQFRQPKPGASPPASPPPRRWGRWAMRVGARATLLVVIAVATFLLFFLLFPWSFDFVDRRLQAVWLSATGLPLTYGESSFQILTGDMSFENVTVLDPATRQPLAKASQIEVNMPLAQLIVSRPPYVIREIRVTGPLDITVVSNEQGLDAGPLGRIIKVIQERRRQEMPGGPPRVVYKHVIIDPVNFTLLRRSDGTSSPTLRLFDVFVESDFLESARPREITMAGKLNRETDDKPLAIKAEVDWDQGTAELNLTAENLASATDLPNKIDSQVNIAKIDIKILANGLNQPAIGLSADAALSQVRVRRNQDRPLLPPQDLTLRFESELRPDKPAVNIKSLNLASPVLKVVLAGSAGLEAPFAYNLAVSQLFLRDEAMTLALHELLGHLGRQLPSRNAHFSYAGNLAGNLRAGRPDVFTGKFEVGGISWNHADSGTVLRGLAANADLTSGSIRLKQARSLVNGIPIRIDGKATGQPLAGEFDNVELNWGIAGELTDLQQALKQNGKEELRLTGDFKGKGKVQLAGPIPRDWRKAMDKADLEGELTFDKVDVQHPRLPRPVRRVKGQMTFSRDEAELKDFSGDIMKVEVAMSARMKGTPHFWNNSDAEVHSQLGFTFDELIPVMDSYLREAGRTRPQWARPDWPKVSGRGKLGVNLTVAGGKWDKPVYDGTLELENARTTLDSQWVNGPLTVQRALIKADAKNLVISELGGKLGSLTLTGSGQMTPRQGEAVLTLAGELAEVKERVPKVLRRFEVGGDVRVDHRFHLGQRPGKEPAADWAALWKAWQERPADRTPQEWLASIWEMNNEGTIGADGMEMTFYRMPSRLTEINGKANYNQRRLWFPMPLPFQGGEKSRGLLGNVEYIFSNPATQFLTFVILGDHFAIDEWARRWRPGPARPRQPVQPPYDPDRPAWFKLHGAAYTSSAAYKTIQLQNFQGKIDFVAYRDQPPMLRWYDLHAELYGGRTTQGGTRYGDHWRYWLLLDKVDVRPLYKDWSGQENPPQGLASGNVSGKVVVQRNLLETDSKIVVQGDLEFDDSRFVSNKIFNSLGGLLKLPIFDEIAFSDFHVKFKMVGDNVTIEKINFLNPIMNIEAEGTYVRKGEMDVDVKLQFFQVAGKVPIVGNILELINKVAGQVFRVKVTGTPDSPNVSLLR